MIGFNRTIGLHAIGVSAPTTVPLDFVRTENGKSTNKTYAFEFEYTDGRAVLTGGTFDTEVPMKK